MSYILDALRRADAERERERSGVPDLHALSPLAMRPDDAPASRPGVLRWAVLGLAGGVIAALGLINWLGREPEPSAAAWTPPGPAPAARPGAAAAPPAVAPPAVAPPAEAPRPSVAAVPAPPPAGAGESVAPAAMPGTAPREGRLLLPEPPVARRPAPAPSAGPSATAAAAATTGTAAPVAAMSASANAAPAAARVPSIMDLPDEQRRQLPPLRVGGSVYSENAAARMLILDGQPYREGDSPAAGLVLVQIRPKSALMQWRGQRFELGYGAP